jgi:hypothetical protein
MLQEFRTGDMILGGRHLDRQVLVGIINDELERTFSLGFPGKL